MIIERDKQIKVNLDSNKPSDKEILKIKKLAKKSLKTKWIKNQLKNSNIIVSPCAFCMDVKTNGRDCSKCKIPKIICYEDGYKGFIGFIFSKYGNEILKHISCEDYNLIRESLKDLLKFGKITPSITKKIEDLLLSKNKI